MSEREVASEGALVYLLIVRRQFVCPFEVRHCNFLLGRRARHGREGEGVQLSALFLPSFCWRYRKLQSFHLASLIGGHGLHSPGLLLRRGREEGGSLPGGERFCSFRPPPPFFFPRSPSPVIAAAAIIAAPFSPSPSPQEIARENNIWRRQRRRRRRRRLRFCGTLPSISPAASFVVLWQSHAP